MQSAILCHNNYETCILGSASTVLSVLFKGNEGHIATSDSRNAAALRPRKGSMAIPLRAFRKSAEHVSTSACLQKAGTWAGKKDVPSSCAMAHWLTRSSLRKPLATASWMFVYKAAAGRENSCQRPARFALLSYQLTWNLTGPFKRKVIFKKLPLRFHVSWEGNT